MEASLLGAAEDPFRAAAASRLGARRTSLRPTRHLLGRRNVAFYPQAALLHHRAFVTLLAVLQKPNRTHTMAHDYRTMDDLTLDA